MKTLIKIIVLILEWLARGFCRAFGHLDYEKVQIHYGETPLRVSECLRCGREKIV